MNFNLKAAQTALLSALLDRLEKSAGTRMISIRVQPERFPEYFDDASPEKVRLWEDAVQELAAQGWIGLDLGKGADSHRIVRVRLHPEHAVEICQLLGRLELKKWRARAQELLKGFAERACEPIEWAEFLAREKIRIEDAEPASMRRAELLEEMETLYSALEKLIFRRDVSFSISWRQFAVAHFANSKRLDSLKPRIAKILADLLGLNSESGETEPSVVLSYFGIQSKEEVFLMQGPVEVCSKEEMGSRVAGEEWLPFWACPATMANSQKMDWDFSRIEAVLTIENEESFHSWCLKNPRPHWLVIYLGGFPSKEKLRFLMNVAQDVKAFHHWGDLDCGGLGIFLFLEGKIGRAIAPMGMAPSWLDLLGNATQSLSHSELQRLQALLQGMSPGHSLIPTLHAMLTRQVKLEQEAILDPL